jgi:hypothetical protein
MTEPARWKRVTLRGNAPTMALDRANSTQQLDRPLPKRLKPDEYWEAWITLDQVPFVSARNP